MNRAGQGVQWYVNRIGYSEQQHLVGLDTASFDVS